MNVRARLIMRMALVGSLSGTAIAGTEVFQVSIGDSSPLLAGSSGQFVLPQFNSRGGSWTLNSVMLELNATSRGGSNTIDNESPFAGTGTVRIGTDINVTGPSSLTVIALPMTSKSGPIPVDSESGPPDPISGNADFVGSDTLTVLGQDVSVIMSSSLTRPFDDLSAYVGGGVVSFDYASAVNSFASADVAPTSSLAQSPEFEFVATIKYSYSAVPEPATALLLAAGVMFLKPRRRKA